MAEMTGYIEDIIKVRSCNLPWHKLNGCNILITGATGLIGSCLVETLMSNPKKDYHVYAAGRNEDRAKKRFASFWNGDDFHFIRHDVMQPLQGDTPYHYIIHAASNASPNFFVQKPVEVMQSNIHGLEHLMDYGLRHGMRRLLYVSSGEVYGEGDGRIFTEDYSGYVDSTSPRSCYPSSKRAAETLCASYASEYGADVVIARPSHVYGPNFTESDNRVYAQFIRNVLHDEDIVMKSLGKQFRSWCYVVDCVSALLHILLKGECGQGYNIADNGSNITIKELAELTADAGGKKVVIDVPDEAEKKGYNPVTKSIFSTEKLEALGWLPQTHIAAGIKKTISQILSIQ
ncbi:MAG: NAD-dependent epimerase/dehydratase family protein [Prevotella sp.]|nr:NAD-dependent epimerase/dehydratase family protein [Prevotella sp.]